MLTGSTILLTGGTGSFGQVFVPMTLEKYNPKKIIVYSRDEVLQWNMAKRYEGDARVQFVAGDVRDAERLNRTLEGVDYVVHAAASKIVPKAEYDPVECIKTNIVGAMNLVEQGGLRGVKKIVALSTDKASSPASIYGASKLVSDQLFLSCGDSVCGGKTRFAVVRYGNVMGSRGSVIPHFMELAATGAELPITDLGMTRFMITPEDSVRLVWLAFDDMLGGEIYVKKIPSMKAVDIARAIGPACAQKVVGVRAGEKMHEQMIGVDDALFTYEYSDYYKILASGEPSPEDPRVKDGARVPDGFSYTSDNNPQWMSVEELQAWLSANGDKVDRT